MNSEPAVLSKFLQLFQEEEVNPEIKGGYACFGGGDSISR